MGSSSPSRAAATARADGAVAADVTLVTTAAQDTAAMLPEAITALAAGLLAGEDVGPRTRADLAEARARHREVQAVTRAVVAAGTPGAPTRVQALAQERLGELAVRCLHLLRRAAQAAADADVTAWNAEVRAALTDLASIAASAHRLAAPADGQGRETLARLVDLRRSAARTRSRLIEAAEAAPARRGGNTRGAGGPSGPDPQIEALRSLARYLERVADLAVSIACEHRNAAGRPSAERRRSVRAPRPPRAPRTAV
ncbi:hypothetical protein [Egicoccus sp. AB-alg2]|uniref:hypothetical protein n=1 Tax=Egicoccus sp. AB-alg2 TaxID=3242693 RepID=UPI00359ECC1A